jgi:hypothetical protein
MKYFISVIVIVVFNFVCQGQVTEVMIDLDSLSDANYSIYNDGFKAAMIYNDTLEAANETPAKLMSSIISANNQEWVNYNTYGGSEYSDKKSNSHFREVINREKDKNYFELLSKLEFDFKRKRLAIVKFYLHLQDNDLGIAGSRVLVFDQNDNRWKVYQEPDLTSIATVIMIFKKDVLERLLTNNPRNSIESSLLEYAYNSRGLNFNLLLNKNYSEQEKDSLTNPLNW